MVIVLCNAVTRGAWGALVRREPGQGDVAGGGALGSWCMRGWAKQLCLKALSRRKQPNPSRNLPATRHFRSGVRHHFITPSSSLDNRGLRWQERFNLGV